MADIPRGKSALVVGGNKGIGAGIAVMLAAKGFTRIMLAGRDAAAADATIARMLAVAPSAAGSSTSPPPSFSFQSVDMSLMRDVKRFADVVKAQLADTGLDLVVVSSGAGPWFGKERIETSEGNERFFMLNYLSRFELFALLRPLVRAAPASPFKAMISVFASGQPHCKVTNLNDPQAIKGNGGVEMSGINGAMNEFMVKEFAERYPEDGIRYIHAFPGLVLSDAWDNVAAFGLSWWWYYLIYPLRLIMSTPAHFANAIVHDAILMGKGAGGNRMPGPCADAVAAAESRSTDGGARRSTWEWRGEKGGIMSGSGWVVSNVKDYSSKAYDYSVNRLRAFL